MSKGYNLPDNVSPNDPEAPWREKYLRRQIIDLDLVNAFADAVKAFLDDPCEYNRREMLYVLERAYALTRAWYD